MKRYRGITHKNGAGELQARMFLIFWRTVALGTPSCLETIAKRMNRA